MAPRRGGSGSGSGGGGDIFVNGIRNCPGCDTSAQSIYAGLFSTADLYGQTITCAIWASALVAVFVMNLKSMGKLLQLAVFFLFASLVLQCVRYGLMIADNWVNHGFRYESSAQTTIERAGIITLFAALVTLLHPAKIVAGAFWLALLLLTGLHAAAAACDFISASSTVKLWEEYDLWRISDRDFSLTMTKAALEQFKGSSYATFTRFEFYTSRMYRLYFPSRNDFADERSLQIKLDLAAGAITVAFLLLLAGAFTFTRLRKKDGQRKHWVWFVAAILAPQISTLFRLVVAAMYVLPNWGAINNLDGWLEWLSVFPGSTNYRDGINPPDTFIPGFRTTVDSFYIVQAVIEPLGYVLSCALLAWGRRVARKNNVYRSEIEPPQNKNHGTGPVWS